MGFRSGSLLDLLVHNQANLASTHWLEPVGKLSGEHTRLLV